MSYHINNHAHNNINWKFDTNAFKNLWKYLW